MGLKITLKPNERIIVNGAVIANCGHNTTLLFMNNASFLREKDIMIEEGVESDEDLLYFLTQLLYIDPGQSAQYQLQIDAVTEALKEAHPDLAEQIEAILSDVRAGQCYSAMRDWRKLFTAIQPGRKRSEIELTTAQKQDQSEESVDVP